MHEAIRYLLIGLALLVGTLLLLGLGRRIGRRRRERDPEGAQSGTAPVEATVFGLLGLLIAFSFSGAGERLDQRRQLVVDEANAIGTAYLRVDLVPEASQASLKAGLRDYLDARLAVYAAFPDQELALSRLAQANAMQGRIWREAVAASNAPGASAGAPVLLLPALNEMFDLSTSRYMATKRHPPVVVFGMLFALALVSALLVGYGMAASRSVSWLHALGFALVLAVTVYVILDLEFPRVGLIRVDSADQVLRDLRAQMR